MASLKTEIVKDLLVIEEDLGNPQFTFGTSSYGFVPSVSEFKRELDNGGYRIVKELTATIRKLNSAGEAVFTTYPTAQNLITYQTDGLKYRVQSVRHDPTGAYFRIIAHSETKGL